MPPAVRSQDLVTVPQLVETFGRDREYHTGVIDGLGLTVHRGPKNATAIHKRDYKRYLKRMADLGRVPSVSSSTR